MEGFATMDSVRIGFVPSYRNGFTPWCQRMREESLAALNQVEGVEWITPLVAPENATDLAVGMVPHGAVRDLDQAESVADYFAAQKVQGLVLCPLDFGDERSAAKIAEKLRLPVLLYATKEPPANEDASLTRVSDSYCGNLSMASALHRREIPFHYAGLFFPSEAALLRQIRHFGAAVAVVSSLRNARIGQVGVRPATFETVAYDERAMVKQFGQNVIWANLSDLVDEALAYPEDDPELLGVMDGIRQSVAQISVSPEHVAQVARLELAYIRFWRQNRLSAMTGQCWRSILHMMGVSVCAMYGRLTQRGMLTACENDVLGALSMLCNYAASMGQRLPHFVDWTIQHREKPDWLLAWHCGNAPPSLACDPSQTALRSRHDMRGEQPIPTQDSQAGLYQFQLQPGPVTFCRLAEYGGQWKMLIAEGRIMPSDETLAGTWAWVQVRDHAGLYRTLVEEGFIHHASMIHGDQREPLRLACKFLGIQTVQVD